MVTTGRPPRTRPPNTVCVGRVARAAAATQSTHCTPTGAGRWQSGHTGRPQRWQRTYDTRSGWRGHTGGAAASGGQVGGGVEIVSPRR